MSIAPHFFRNQFVSLVGLLTTVACGAQPTAVAPTNASVARVVAASVAPTAGEGADSTVREGQVRSEGSLEEAAKSCKSAPCRLDQALVETLCSGKNPSAAIAMFAIQSPWERAYVRMNEVDSINTLGGPSSNDPLVFDEEVVVLTGGHPKGTMSVSGADGQHVLRLDGTCATVMSEELTSKRPPAPRYAMPRWAHLENEVQEALLQDPAVKTARRAQRDACQGSGIMTANTPCRTAQQRLADAITKAIKRPISLPDVRLGAL